MFVTWEVNQEHLSCQPANTLDHTNPWTMIPLCHNWCHPRSSSWKTLLVSATSRDLSPLKKSFSLVVTIPWSENLRSKTKPSPTWDTSWLLASDTRRWNNVTCADTNSWWPELASITFPQFITDTTVLRNAMLLFCFLWNNWKQKKNCTSNHGSTIWRMRGKEDQFENSGNICLLYLNHEVQVGDIRHKLWPWKLSQMMMICRQYVFGTSRHSQGTSVMCPGQVQQTLVLRRNYFFNVQRIN